MHNITASSISRKMHDQSHPISTIVLYTPPQGTFKNH